MLEKKQLSWPLKIYGLLWLLLLWPLLWCLGFLSPAWRAQLEGRRFDEQQLLQWIAARKSKLRCAIFFCSSAGEYEQAKPMMTRLCAKGDWFVLVVLVSISGQRFACAQEEDLPVLLAPFDQPQVWQQIFAGLLPDFFVVVRYELWPGFLSVARSWAPIYLVNAVCSPSLLNPGSARLLRRWLVGMCRGIFVVGRVDQAFYVEILEQDRDQIFLVGDTKYDRVLERLQERAGKRLELAQQLARFVGHFPVLILGSAWPKDLDALLSVYRDLQQMRPGIKLILAPHDVGPSMVSWMERRILDLGLQICRAQETGFAAAKESDDVLLVDRIGILPELYALADIAWIGGAMHYRVHNVLEAACQGLYVCFGPLYHTSQEASQLVAADLVRVIESGEDFLQWVRQLQWHGRPPHQRLHAAVLEHQGASERILQKIFTDLALSTR